MTLVPTGHMVGKTFVAAGSLHEFLTLHPAALVVATAPTQTQLEEVLWKEVERAYRGSRIPLGGRLLKSPLKVDLGGGWQALGYSTTTAERFSGHHEYDLLVLVDEASGVEDEIFEAIGGLGPSRQALFGNPLRPDGTFYERCHKAPTNPLANVIQISSLDSPDIHLARSPRGLANATWLESVRNDYGEGSLWWTCHVLGLFPDSGVDTLLPRSWIDRCAAVEHVRSGPARTAIDLALGNGGARSVVATRDDNGLLALEWSNTWKLEETAAVALLQVRKFGVDHGRVSWDVGGLGADFANRLEAVGIVGARPYMGGLPGGKRYGNLRSAAAWQLRQRLDPGRMVSAPTGRMVVQPAFSIRPEWVAVMRDELQGLRYEHGRKSGKVELELKEDFEKRLKKSPDMADCLTQLFAWPN